MADSVSGETGYVAITNPGDSVTTETVYIGMTFSAGGNVSNLTAYLALTSNPEVQVSDMSGYSALVDTTQLQVSDLTAYNAWINLDLTVTDTTAYSALLYTDPAEPNDFFPYPPDSVTERWEFLTDIVVTNDGSEDATIQRAVPRKSFTYSVPLNSPYRQRLFNMLDQNLRGSWKLPIWTEAQQVDSIFETDVNVDPYGSDYRIDSRLLSFVSYDIYEVRHVTYLNQETDVISVSSDLTTARPSYVMPVLDAVMLRDAMQGVGAYSDSFKFEFRVEAADNVRPYLCLCITPHYSASGPGSLQGPNLHAMVDVLRGLYRNSGYKIDIRWYFWNDVNRPRYDYYDCVDADFDDMDTQIDARPYTGGTIPNSAATWALDWFESENPNPGNGARKDVWIFIISQGATNLTPAATTAADMIGRTGAFTGSKEVDVYGMVINQTTSIQIVKIDNVDHNLIPDTTADRPVAMTERFNDVIYDQGAGYRFGQYEILGAFPDNGNDKFERSFIRREDVTDFGGVVEVRSPWSHGRLMTNHSFLAEGLVEVQELKNSVLRAMGMGHNFWIPSLTNSLLPRAISSDFLTLTVLSKNMNSYGDDRNYIAVLDENGYWRAYAIESVAPNGDEVDITLTTPLPTGIMSADIVCWLGFGRFNSDKFEFQWIGNKAVRLNIQTMEISR